MKRSIATVSLSGTLPEKLEAAAAAGFDGVELFENDLLYHSGSPQDIRRLCEDLGIAVTLFQPFRDFEGCPRARVQRNLDRAERKFDLMHELGVDLMLLCSNVQADALGDNETLVGDLGQIAERAGARGLRVGYEALAWGRHVKTWRQVWSLVQQVDNPALGVILDSFHTLALGDDPSGIVDIPGERIFFVQLADAPLLAAAGYLLLVVFALKGAILPLYFWLPRAYASATAPVAALFAIMTKVGLYAIIRVFTLVFGSEAGELSGMVDVWLWPLALLTLGAAVIGALAARSLQVLLAYLVVVSVGTLLAGIALGSEAGLAAALYYLVHSTLVAGGLFLLADLIARQRGDLGTDLISAPALRQFASVLRLSRQGDAAARHRAWRRRYRAVGRGVGRRAGHADFTEPSRQPGVLASQCRGGGAACRCHSGSGDGRPAAW